MDNERLEPTPETDAIFKNARHNTMAEVVYWIDQGRLHAKKLERSREQLKKHLGWALEFVVEPDFFPNEGDRQRFKERLDVLRSRYMR